MAKLMSDPSKGCVMCSENWQCGLQLHWQGKGEECYARVVGSEGYVRHEGTYRTALAWLQDRGFKRA